MTQFFTQEYEKGYQDYVKGFVTHGDESDQYLKGFNAARNDFFNDVPYNEIALGGLYW